VYRIDVDSVPRYIGAGSGLRAWDHFDLAERGSEVPFHKFLATRAVSSDVRVVVLRQNLSEAEAHVLERKLIESNPCVDIKPLKEPKTNIQPFSFEELSFFIEKLKKVDKEWHDLVIFWSHTGLRPGEMLALKWEDVDFFNKQISIRRTRTGNRDTTPKTSHSERDISLIDTALDALKRQQERTALKSEYIWPQTWIGHFRDRFKTLCRICGLKQRPPSQMRHTFATLHIAAGENPEWVSKTMGHSSLKITLEKYSRYIPNLTRKDGSAFDAILKKGKKRGNDAPKLLNLG